MSPALDTNRCGVRGRDGAFAVIEYAFSLLFFIGLFLAGFDIVRIVQVRQALFEAARISAREIAALTGHGSVLNPGTRQSLYRWHIYGWHQASIPRLEVVRVLSHYPQGQVPSECFSAPKCEPEFEGFDSGSSPELNFDIPGVIESYGRPALQAAVPRARFDCLEPAPHCVSYQGRVFVQEHVEPQLEYAEVTYRYHLPLLLLSRFHQGNVLTVSARVRQATERSFRDDKSLFISGWG